ncbi:MAG: carbamoyl-phosphate synthase large subunit [Candidatus Omnitrophota bacterium]|nr:carbamoyl-phosphate synthase large subunit [Candidatus Omnitrophota bacterium]MBU1929854.1 carbamoyl-phosphate synthase large subunit [Candidatus Omnitrophota bacterium]MBU2034669.1 carbamoyl-phosphate synthase large subunit [Candidatus Omnitrophota bacterium]MBU2221989.1 carbamoyl-phosphate synthase large subunit [Candidatus Omnitrophota bacterium]
MPRRKDIKKVLMIGSGPIIIGQACEFDYSGSQACKALKEEGYFTILINSNPATIMTDPGLADVTYIEPLNIDMITKIIAKEKPDAILPTLGGQTGLNLAFFLMKQGILKKYGVESIGASVTAISCAEDRELFKKAMQEIGIDLPKSGIANSVEQGMKIGLNIGFPLILRPAYCLGGSGGAIVYNKEELEKALDKGLEVSPVRQILVEESVLGWKEIEFEVMRDCVDNVIMITSMENVDPMGVHTGDSMVVAPAQTLTAEEYNNFVNLSKKIIRRVGITGGGANIQFGQNPDNGRIVIIEVNPRLSRSSALASKATGFPIARVATKLAVGLTLPEVMNQITGKTTSFFEPTIDYCVFKICRFTFEKFPKAERTLNTSMKAVGEAMSIGRNFKEALQKGIRSMEISRFGFGCDGKDKISDEALKKPDEALTKSIRDKIRIPNDERIFYLRYALKIGLSIDEIYEFSKIDRWFIDNMKQLVETEDKIRKYKNNKPEEAITLPVELLIAAKKDGFSDRQISYLLNAKEEAVREYRKKNNLKTVYKLVDTSAGEFNAKQPYFYSTQETQDEARPSKNKKVVILGGGPNRIGQGIEFDYCCCHAAYALKEEGIDSIMVNCNPETVSTDYDTSDRLYFEPLTQEDILNIIEVEKPIGVIVQFGGQTPLNLAVPLRKAGVSILGTSSDNIDIAEDRKRFKHMLEKLNLRQPESGTVFTFQEAKQAAQKIGYPVLVRPSYVLGGRAMEIVYDEELLEKFIKEAAEVSGEHPVLIDKFLEDAIEVDVDLIGDSETFVIGGILEHIEEAGIHSGDSAMALPTFTLSQEVLNQIREATYKMAKELNVVGLMNVQYAVKDGKVFVLEVNPRASRTVPFVSKVIGVPLAKLATKIMLGKSLKELGFTQEIITKHVAVKESVFPFNRFPGVDVILGPEMKSTGEVMGLDKDFGRAYIKSQLAAGQNLPKKGNCFISVRDRDKRAVVFIAKKLKDIGFNIYATLGTSQALEKSGIPVKVLPRLAEGRPNVLDLMKDGKIQWVINTPSGRIPRQDEVKIRSQVILYNIPYTTTISGAQATVNGIEAFLKKDLQVQSLQKYHKGLKKRPR